MTEIVIINVHEDTSVIHQNKAYLLVNPAAVSDFKKALRRKHTMRLSEDSALHTKALKTFYNQADAPRKSEIAIK